MKHYVVVYSFGAPQNSVGYVISYHRTPHTALDAWETFRKNFHRRNPNSRLHGGVYQVTKQYKRRDCVYKEYVIAGIPTEGVTP